MKVLGLDTSGYANAIGIVDGEEVLADFNYPAKTDSLEKIVAHIDAALTNAHLKLADIEGFGVGLGPGSWTGIRVGVTVGKILAYSTRKPVAGIATLEILAYAARNKRQRICAVINAGTRDTVYAAFYRVNNGALVRAGDYYVGDVPGLAALINGPVALVSTEAQHYRQAITQATGVNPLWVEAVVAIPGGAAVARLAAGRLERGESDDALALTPLYLKESTARAFIGRYMRAETKGT